MTWPWKSQENLEEENAGNLKISGNDFDPGKS